MDAVYSPWARVHYLVVLAVERRCDGSPAWSLSTMTRTHSGGVWRWLLPVDGIQAGMSEYELSYSVETLDSGLGPSPLPL
eukprot:3279785-Amphidinium_carterae.1